MMRVGIGIHRRQGSRQAPDFLLSLRRAVAAAEGAWPQVEFDIVADAPELVSLQTALFDGTRQAGFFVADHGLLHYRCLAEIVGLFLERGETALIEAKAVPLESPRRYDPHTLQTEWCNKDRLLIPRGVFAQLGTFDRELEGMFDDVDYSWRAQAAHIDTLIHPGAWYHCSPAVAPPSAEPSNGEAARRARVRLLNKWQGQKHCRDGWFAETRWEADQYWLAGQKW